MAVNTITDNVERRNMEVFEAYATDVAEFSQSVHSSVAGDMLTLYGDFVILTNATSNQPLIRYTDTAALKHINGYTGNMNLSSLCG